MLTLKIVARFYGSRLLFKDVSLAVEAGTVTLLAGPNGAGKTTLLKIMAGLLRPSAGAVRRADCSVGFLGHQTFVYPTLTAEENLLFWSRLHGFSPAEKDMARVLERVELAPYAGEKAGGFSRGMAQRLNLARVLLQAPRILLLDEPGSGLDARGAAMLHREIASAKADGAAVVWITHALREDIVRADRVALLENRRLARLCPADAYEIQN
jgi:heme exporter protein A